MPHVPAGFRPDKPGYAPLLAGAVPFDAGPEPWKATVRRMCRALERQLKKLEDSKPRPDRPDICWKNARTLDMLVRLYERLLQRQAQVAAMHFAGPKRNNEGSAEEFDPKTRLARGGQSGVPYPGKAGRMTAGQPARTAVLSTITRFYVAPPHFRLHISRAENSFKTIISGTGH